MGSTLNFLMSTFCLDYGYVRRFKTRLFPSLGTRAVDVIKLDPVSPLRNVDALHAAQRKFDRVPAHSSRRPSHHPKLKDAAGSGPGTAVSPFTCAGHVFYDSWALHRNFHKVVVAVSFQPRRKFLRPHRHIPFALPILAVALPGPLPPPHCRAHLGPTFFSCERSVRRRGPLAPARTGHDR